MKTEQDKRLKDTYRNRLLNNPRKIVPTALNTGIREAQGAIIIRMDAHNIYEKDYVSKCVRYVQEYNVDNVGGIWVTLPGSDNVLGKSIALALSYPFGVGNAYFRIGAKEPKLEDVLSYGYFKPLVVKKVGAVLTGRQLMPAFFVGSLIISGIFSPLLKPFLLL